MGKRHEEMPEYLLNLKPRPKIDKKGKCLIDKKRRCDGFQ
jgi:hypothetical protein